MNEIPRNTSDTWARSSAGLSYLRRGWSVIPIRPNEKRPLIAWRSYQMRRAAPRELLGWFRRWPEANLAVVTGAVSGLVVLDLDPAHGGMESLAELARTHGPLPPTLSAVSGGGGLHLYFAHPGTAVGNRTGLLPGLDVRGDGGYIVAPPSRHASGACYRWDRGPESHSPVRYPEWLRANSPGAPKRTTADWQRVLRAGVEQGRRNATAASLAGHLLRRGVAPEVTLELLLGWNATRCRPPMPEAEVVRTVASIQGAEERRRTLPRPVEDSQDDWFEEPRRASPAAARAMERHAP